MPLYIPCGNTQCDGRADKIGGLCADCQRKAEEAQKREQANKWRWYGFPKTTDNHRRGYKKP